MTRRTALVSAASGIGDVIRITPLIRVCAELGYTVDVLLVPDCVESVELVAGAPEVRQLFYLPSRWSRDTRRRLDGLSADFYDIATFTTLSAPYRRLVRARRVFECDVYKWRQEGDVSCVEEIARALGWRGPLPPPFARASERVFDIQPRTVALHPGCKPGWPWKRWHGFPQLASFLPHVAVVGTASDLDNTGTYFEHAFEWPDHVQSFVGALGLRDTAALLRQCVALVSNDSGMMQLAVALGVPTFGIFGLTSPQREAFAVPNMHVISKALPCEPQCRLHPWGRRDCEYHLHCLKTLAPLEVLDAVHRVMPALRSPAENLG
jgi:ADP-heptose:LPS heptosyltransferase